LDIEIVTVLVEQVGQSFAGRSLKWWGKVVQLARLGAQGCVKHGSSKMSAPGQLIELTGSAHPLKRQLLHPVMPPEVFTRQLQAVHLRVRCMAAARVG
jgi:hypothetical protein